MIRDPRYWRGFWGHTPRVKLTILGVEVIQAIQRFNLTQPEQNNSIRLVARKRTMVRVYVGWQPPKGTTSNLIANVTGTLKLSSEDGAVPAVTVAPINVVAARPVEQIDRFDLNHTLDFALLDQAVEMLTGSIRLEAEVHVKGIIGLLTGLGARDSSTVVEFHERRLGKQLTYVLVRNGNVPWPTDSDYLACLEQVIARFPVPDNDFDPVQEVHARLQNNDDLSESITPVVSQVEPILWGLPPGKILSVLVAAPSSIYQHGSGVPGTPVVFMSTDDFPHELSHYFGLGHSEGDPNGGSDPRGIPTDFDGGEPDLMGIDMSTQKMIWHNTSETMIYITSSPTWCSPKSWDLLFEAFPP